MAIDVKSPARAADLRTRVVALLTGARAYLPRIARRERWSLIASALIPLVFWTVMLRHSPYDRVFEFDPDEGNNVIKALLLEHGYRFSDEIWSDQPPLFSTLLRLAFLIFGWEPAVGRVLVLGFAGVLVWTVYDTVRRTAGVAPALTSVGLLVMSAEFVPLSVSIMIGLPAVCWAALAFWGLGRWLSSSRWPWLMVSAIGIGLSVGTKMFTAFLVPLMALCVGIAALKPGPGQLNDATYRTRLHSALKIGGLFSVVLAGVLLLTLWPVLSAKDPLSLFRTHLIARDSVITVDDLSGAKMVPRFIRNDATIVTLAWLGVLQAVWRRSASMLAWAGWFILALICLYFHQPVWVHHRLLITLPGCVLAGWSLGATFSSEPAAPTSTVAQRAFRPWLKPALRTLLGSLIVGGLIVSEPSRVDALSAPPDFGERARDQAFQRKINEYVEHLELMVSARQMYAFRAGVPVPPELAVTSIKRFHSGLLRTADILRSIEKHRPGMVVLTARWPLSVRRDVRKALLRDYTKVHEDPLNMRAELWVLPEVIEKANQTP